MLSRWRGGEVLQALLNAYNRFVQKTSAWIRAEETLIRSRMKLFIDSRNPESAAFAHRGI